MAFNGSFSVSQTSDVSAFILTDDSTGSDGNLTGRTVYLYKANGDLLGGTTVDWPLPLGTPITIDLLDRDYSLNIIVQWTSSSPLPSPSTYSLASIETFTGNTFEFIYGLIQEIAARNTILNDSSFYEYLSKLQTELDNAINAGTHNDQWSAQSALDRAYWIISHQNIYF